MDDVNIYNRILSADEIYSQYDTRTPADILKEEGFSVQSKLTMLKGETRKISAEMLDVIKNAEPKITYESNNTDIAAVDASGVVTGVAAGEAVVTTTVKIDDISVSENTTIVVNENADPVMKDYAVYYDMSSHTATSITDVSGHGNDAAIKGSSDNIW